MLSNERGAQVSHGKLLWRQGRDSFLVLPFHDQPLPFTLCAILGCCRTRTWALLLARAKHAGREFPCSPCLWYRANRGSCLLWADLPASHLTHGHLFSSIPESNSTRWQQGQAAHAALHITAPWFGSGQAGSIWQAGNGSLPMIRRQFHSHPLRGTDVCAASRVCCKRHPSPKAFLERTTQKDSKPRLSLSSFPVTIPKSSHVSLSWFIFGSSFFRSVAIHNQFLSV